MAPSWIEAILLLLLCDEVLALLPQGLNMKPVLVETRLGTLQGTRRKGNVGIGEAPNTSHWFKCHAPNPFATQCPIEETIPEIAETVDEFLGVPYAAPPVNQRRFKAPSPLSPWQHVYDATYHRPVCPQDAPQFNMTQRSYQDEDCLYLNIYSPFQADSPSTFYPVMVFIHGGSYVYGTGNRYNGTALAQKGVVLIAINYRLGALGFLTTGDPSMPGNYGLLDQIQALKWIRENIRAFRGDQDKITIFGSSAGGASVGILLLSPMTKGLFHRAIAQSGTPNAVWASHTDRGPKELRQHVVQLAAAHACPRDDDVKMLKCLRNLPWHHFRSDEICKTLTCIEVDPLFKPVPDGVVVREDISTIIQKCAFPVNIPYMTGTVRAEFGDHFTDSFTREEMSAEVDAFVMNKYGNAASQAVMQHYTDWTRNHVPIVNNTKYAAQHYNRAEVLTDMGLVAPTSEVAGSLALQDNSKVYLYYFDNHPSFHSVELNYVFGVAFIGGSVDEMGVLTNFSSLDQEKSRFFMDVWVNFAKYGKPIVKPTSIAKEWRKVQADTMNYLRIDFTQPELTATMETHLQGPEVALWNILVPELVSSCSGSDHDLSDFSHHHKTWIFFGLTIALLAVVILLLCVIIWGTQKNKKYTQLLRNNSEKSYAVNL